MVNLNANNILHPKTNLNFHNTVRFLQLEMTHRCNASCLNCVGNGADRTCKDMPLDKSLECLEGILDTFNIENIFFSCNGEFSLYKDNHKLLREIDKLIERKNYAHKYFSYDSNGIILSDEMIDALNSIKNYTFSISFSFWNGTEKEYNEYHKNHNFNDIIDNIHKFYQKVHNKNVHLRFSAPYVNKEQFESATNTVRDIIKQYGKDLIVRDYFMGRDLDEAALKNQTIFYQRKWIIIEDDASLTIKDKEQERKLVKFNGCPYLGMHVIINAKGDISPCLQCNTMPHYRLGNVFEQKCDRDFWLNLYNSDKIKELYANNFRNNVYPLKECETCSTRITY